MELSQIFNPLTLTAAMGFASVFALGVKRVKAPAAGSAKVVTTTNKLYGLDKQTILHGKDKPHWFFSAGITTVDTVPLTPFAVEYKRLGHDDPFNLDKLTSKDDIQFDFAGTFDVRVNGSSDRNIVTALSKMGGKDITETRVADLVLPLIKGAVRQAASWYKAEDMQSREFAEQLKKTLRSRLGNTGFEVSGISIKKLEPTSEEDIKMQGDIRPRLRRYSPGASCGCMGSCPV